MSNEPQVTDESELDLIPLALQEMRLAWGGHVPETSGERQAAAWLAEDRKGFRTAKARLEGEYLAAKTKRELAAAAEVVPVAGGGGENIVAGGGSDLSAGWLDGGSRRALEVAEEWLAVHGVRKHLGGSGK